ncbi:hypothetical protein PEDI_30030 [Persicobacter diffluens]|uniref:Uncharacterized protein n=1 Tax=Persicobacter diffluens TaxID=981 RepID=A0AAN4VYL4_9BACT|nr:hypothetical protein PEDI_30030 [Persicobacter diffluens]
MKKVLPLPDIRISDPERIYYLCIKSKKMMVIFAKCYQYIARNDYIQLLVLF